ncbi:MAG: enoyl-CoA hydratase/isomerase family protein [Deltaproteobacteria bacterium]|nr:enoyl-CoA hydratase/isomerase family protein [Deltaproteobacteria bacterium]
MAPPVLLTRHGATAVVALNRPAVRNAVDMETVDALAAALDGLRADGTLRCVVFTAEGSEAFCSGGDLRAFRALQTWEDAYRMSTRMQRSLHALETLPVPVIGVLNGYAMGGGCEAILATDIRVMEEHAFLSFKQLQLGVSLGWGGAARLARDLGARHAFRLLLQGEKLFPAEARALGMVDEVVPRGTGRARALALGEQYAALPPLAVNVLKRMVHQDQPDRVHQEASIFATTWASRDHHEAVDAFFEKRPPRWEGR